MPAAPLPSNEGLRLAYLRSLSILDTPREPAFDRLAMVAAQLFRTPISLVCFVDGSRNWFKAHVGTNLTESPRSMSFCGYTILSNQTLVVQDARKDERFFDNPTVVSGPQLRFYAGAPIIGAGGYNLGSVCVFDRRPQAPTDIQLTYLRQLAQGAMNLIKTNPRSAVAA